MRTLAAFCAALVALVTPAQAQDCQGHLCKVAVTLSAAQIRALPTTGVELVAAPGAGKMLVPQRAVLSFHWVANVTNIASTAALGILHNDGFGMLTNLFEQPSSQINNLLANDEDALAILAPLIELDVATPKPYAQQFSTSVFANTNLTIRGFNGVLGNWTGGDGSTLVITLYYLVVDL